MPGRTQCRRWVGAVVTLGVLLAGAAACDRNTGARAAGGAAATDVARTAPVAAVSSVPASAGARPQGTPTGSRTGGRSSTGTGRAPGTPGTPTARGGSEPAAQPGLDAVAGRLVPYLQRHFGAVYSALLVDDPHNQLVVYRLPDLRLDAVARSIAGRTRLTFVDARYSFDRQLQLLARITADHRYWRHHGITVNSWGATNGVHCAVIVTTSQGSAEQQLAFDARYGTGAVLVVKGGPMTGYK